VTEVATGRQVSLWDSASNPNLEAEQSLNTELGYRWQTDRYQVGISAFRDKYTNFVEVDEFILNPSTQYRACTGNNCTVTMGKEYSMVANVGEVTVKGVEVEGRWLISQQWSARLAWSYSEGEKDNGDPLPQSSKNQVNLSTYFENIGAEDGPGPRGTQTCRGCDGAVRTV